MSKPKPLSRRDEENESKELKFEQLPPSRSLVELNARLERRIHELGSIQKRAAQVAQLPAERRQVAVIGLVRVEEILGDYGVILASISKELTSEIGLERANKRIEELEWQLEKWFAIVEAAFVEP